MSELPADDFFFPGGREGGKILSVSRLNLLVKNNLEQVFGEVAVKGEVSNLSTSFAGHTYFTLKDDDAEVSAVWFKSARAGAPLEDGAAVVVRGLVSLYEPRGIYQIIVRSVSPEGKGSLRKRFERLAARLKQEGLFDESHKKPLPLLPRVIGIVTSKTGAALRDMLKVIWSRFPGAHVVVGHASVQGKAAAGEIARMIELFNRWGKADVLIVGRGGGSLEDLWAFNEETVARAVFRSRIPVVSAVGHEIDVTIADLAADARALTPTKAGELVVPDVRAEDQRLDALAAALRLHVSHLLASRRRELERYRTHRIFASPEAALRLKLARVRAMAERLGPAARRCLAARRERAAAFAGVLERLNPLAALKRGFSYTEKEGRPLTDAACAAPGDVIRTRLRSGRILSVVKKVSPGEKEGTE